MMLILRLISEMNSILVYPAMSAESELWLLVLEYTQDTYTQICSIYFINAD